MEPTQAGVVFRTTPPILGGGIAQEVIAPGQRLFLWPWEQVYRFETATRDISWGSTRGFDKEKLLFTRAKDGNEVALSVTVSYQVSTDPEKLRRLVQEVASNDQQLQDLVVAIARSDIRSVMNELGTFEFRQVKSRYDAINRARELMGERLNRYGIEIVKVTLDDFQFARPGPDGTPITTYQDKINLIQQIVEDTKRELSKRDTVVAEKAKELETEQGVFDRKEAEAAGYLDQSKKRGDAYFQSRSNEAKGILATGQAEVEGITEQIAALSGPGGTAILKLELTKQLLKNDPRFVLTGSSGKGNALEVNRLDTNQLLSQAGVFEGLQSQVPPVTTKPQPPAITTPVAAGTN